MVVTWSHLPGCSTHWSEAEGCSRVSRDQGLASRGREMDLGVPGKTLGPKGGEKGTWEDPQHRRQVGWGERCTVVHIKVTPLLGDQGSRERRHR